MSEHASVSGDQIESQTDRASNGQPSKGKARDMMQIETIKELDEIVSAFIAQKSSIHDACRLLTTTLDENPSLTGEQRSATYRTYGGCLEEAYAARLRAIALGEQEPRRPLGGAVAPAEA